MTNSWEQRNVFVTGANGFVGSWLVKGLVERKARVTVLVRDLPSRSTLRLFGLSEKIDIVWGSLADLLLLERVLATYEIDLCFHLAAEAIVGVAHKSPLATFESNTRGTWNLLEACRKNGVPVIVASSDKAYGQHDTLPYTETHSLNARHPYDVSKACADLVSRCYAHTYGLPVAVTRFANIYGGGDFNYSRIVPGTIKSVHFGEEVVIRSDGTPLRDYVYIEDVVAGYLLLGERLEEVKGEAVNFGSGKPVSVLHLVKTIMALQGKTANLKVLGAARGEIDKQYLSSEKARTLLGWWPRYDLEAGLRETVRWYQDFFRCEGKPEAESSLARV